MSHELERRLERLFRDPRASIDVEERARGLALAALPAPTRAANRLRTLLIAVAATAFVLAVTAGALATVGALHVSLGAADKPRPPAPAPAVAPQLEVPTGSSAVAAVVDGRLWLTTRDGLRIQGLPVDAATLSPHALYVAAGIGSSLIAMAPNGTRAWSHPVHGPVVAIAWAPDALQIAYVVRTGHRFQLRMIEGNGTHDQLLDGGVRPVVPSWRADSLAVAYVGAGGLPVVYDFGHVVHHVLRREGLRGATRLAFAPTGRTLAVLTPHAFAVVGGSGHDAVRDLAPDSIGGAAWLHDELAVALNPPHARVGAEGSLDLFRIGFHSSPVQTGRLVVPGRIVALDAVGARAVIAVKNQHAQMRVLASSPITGPRVSAQQVLLEVPLAARIDALAVR